MSRFHLHRILALLALAAPASLVDAAPPTASATGTATVLHPVSVLKLRDMDFGYLWPNAVGTAVLEPNADALSTTGGVVAVGGTPHSAEFAGSAQSSAVVNI